MMVIYLGRCYILVVVLFHTAPCGTSTLEQRPDTDEFQGGINKPRFPCPVRQVVNVTTQPGERVLLCSLNHGFNLTLAVPSDYFWINDTSVYLKQSLDALKNKDIILSVQINDGNGNSFTSNITFVIEHNVEPKVKLFSNSSGESGFFKNGTNVRYVCAAVYFKSKPTIKWSLSDSQGEVRQTKRLQVTEAKINNTWISVFSFSPILQRDMGTLTCSVTGDGLPEKKVVSVNVMVISKPNIIARPSTASIGPGQAVKLTCLVRDPLLGGAQMKWYQLTSDNKTLIAESKEPLQQLTLTVNGLRSDTRYICEGVNAVGSQFSNTVSVTVIPNEVKNCPTITGANGVVWMETKAGSYAESVCPTPLTGTSSRRCNGDGQWEAPNYDSNCQQNTFARVLEIAKNAKEGSNTNPPGVVIDELANAVDSLSMTAQDVDVVLQVMEAVANGLLSPNATLINADGIEKLVRVAGRILRQQSAGKSDSRGPKSLLWSVDTVAKNTVARLSRTSPESLSEEYNVTVSTDTIFFQIGSVKNEGISFPGDRTDNPAWLKEQAVFAYMPQATMTKIGEQGDGRVWFSGVVYRTVGELMNKQDLEAVDKQPLPSAMADDMKHLSKGVKNISTVDVVSRVMAFSVYPEMKIFDPPLYLTMQVSRTDSDPICSFINYDGNSSSGTWENDGCTVVSRDGDVIVCGCNHTTNFAILMRPVDVGPHDDILSLISIIGCGISMFFLLLTIVVYCIAWRHVIKSRVAKVKSVLLMHLCVTLIISYSLFLGGAQLTQNKDVCTALAALLHYFFLVVFFVMLAEGVHLFISIVIVINFASYLKGLVIMIWVTPALIVGITLGVLKVDGYTQQRYCWLSTERSVIWAFIGPALFIICVNAGILVLALRKMMTRKNWEDNVIKQGKYLARGLGVLLPIIGVVWVFGVFAVNRDLLFFQYMFAICNSLQGVFIFIFHCLTSNVRGAFKEMRNRFNRQSISKSTMKTESTMRRKSSSLSPNSTTKSYNSNFTLSLTTNPLRSKSLVESKGAHLSRLITLPSVFYLDGDTQTQNLIKEDNISDRDNISPTSGKHVNVGFMDGRKHVSFPSYYEQEVNLQDEMPFPLDSEVMNMTALPAYDYLPEESIQETDLEYQLRMRRQPLDQMYAVCNAFAELRKNKVNGDVIPWYQSREEQMEAGPATAKSRWMRAVESITASTPAYFSRQFSRESGTSVATSRQLSYEGRGDTRSPPVSVSRQLSNDSRYSFTTYRKSNQDSRNRMTSLRSGFGGMMRM